MLRAPCPLDETCDLGQGPERIPAPHSHLARFTLLSVGTNEMKAFSRPEERFNQSSIFHPRACGHLCVPTEQGVSRRCPLQLSSGHVRGEADKMNFSAIYTTPIYTK